MCWSLRGVCWVYFWAPLRFWVPIEFVWVSIPLRGKVSKRHDKSEVSIQADEIKFRPAKL